MRKERIVQLVQEGATSAFLMTQCLNEFTRWDMQNASELEKSHLYMAVKRFASIVRFQPYPKGT